jgi:hypothetical protein
MGVLAAKLVLAPTFVVAASLAARHYGARVGGLIGGLPVVAGPILLVFALSHGRAFAAEASAATLLGIASLCAFVVVYARLAAIAHWGAILLSGWLAFIAMTAALNALSVSAGVALGCAVVAVGLALIALPRPQGAAVEKSAPPTWDLPLRAVSALALVLALTALAGQLGSRLSGLLAPFPVIASVLAVFTHVLHGERDLVGIMRGFLAGLVAYSLFCFVLAESLPILPIAASFALAVATALVTQTVALALDQHRFRPSRRPNQQRVGCAAATTAVASDCPTAPAPDTADVAQPM